MKRYPFLFVFLLLALKPAIAQVASTQKISDTQGSFTATLDDGDFFGVSAALIGDLDGDTVPDLAVGAFLDDDGSNERGAIYILFLNADGTVASHQKISDTQGGFTASLDDDYFGAAITSLGDLDGDGINDLAVGAILDDDGGGFDRGAVYILFMNTDGTVKAHQKISDTDGGFTAAFTNDDQFGYSVTGLGDFDGDTVPDLAAGVWRDDDGGSNRGAVYIMLMNTDGTVKSHQKISDTQGGFTASLTNNDHFGYVVANIGDLDGDGVTDLVAGAPGDNDGGADAGAAYILFLNSNGTVKSHQKISNNDGNFLAGLANDDLFGTSAASLGDRDGDGVIDIAVAAPNMDDGANESGGLFLLYLNTDGTVREHEQISNNSGGLGVTLDGQDFFGQSLNFMGDINGDGAGDLAVGAYGDDDGGTDRGAAYVLFLTSYHPLDSGSAADGVLGQPNFTSSAADNGGISASSLDGPTSVAVGPTGKVFVSDSDNHRILRWSAVNALISGSAAEAVLGQANFTSSSANRGSAAAANTLYEPAGLFVTAADELFVADSRNHRVLRFDNAESAANGSAADAVLGQADFTSSSANRGGTAAANTLRWPIDVYVDDSGHLWVADWLNHRVLRYDNATAKANGAGADGVLGQASFTTSLRIWKDNADGDSFAYPSGVAVDASGALFVSDAGSSRVLRFDNAESAANGSAADAVLGQADFTSWNTNRGSTTPAENTLQWPSAGLDVDNQDRLWVADRWADRVIWFDDVSTLADGADATGYLGQPNFTSRDGAVDSQSFNSATDVFIDTSSERVWIVDGGFNRVLHFDANSGSVAKATLPEETEAPEEPPQKPETYALHQNYPNPVGPTTTIGYRLRERSRVAITIYDVMGREVTRLVDEEQEAGAYSVRWDASQLSSGIYLCRMQTPNWTRTRKMVVIR